MGKEQKISSEGKASPKESTPEKVVEKYIAKLNKKRHKVGEEHRRYQERHPSKFGREGSIDVYTLSMKIEGAVELAQQLDIIDKDKDPSDFLQ